MTSPSSDVSSIELTNSTATQHITDNSKEQEYLNKHAHHENAHLAMILILILALIVTQFGILEWRKRNYRSFSRFSMVGLAFVPLVISINAGFKRFVVLWVLFALLNSWIIYRGTRRPLASKTPRLVYKWFEVIYKICYGVGVFGYIIVMFTFLGITQIFASGEQVFGFGLLSLFYGLYFGVLGRDIIEFISDYMAYTIGYYTPEGIPHKHLRENICSICGDPVNLENLQVPDPSFNIQRMNNANRFQYAQVRSIEWNDDDGKEKALRLACRHVFHEQCIRGWAIIGKKDVCPYCKEKVDMKELSLNPWDKTQLYYLQLIDGLRYLVVWQPLIFLTVHGIYKLFGLS